MFLYVFLRIITIISFRLEFVFYNFGSIHDFKKIINSFLFTWLRFEAFVVFLVGGSFVEVVYIFN